MLEGGKCDEKKRKQGKGHVECWHVEKVKILDIVVSVSLGVTLILL